MTAATLVKTDVDNESVEPSDESSSEMESEDSDAPSETTHRSTASGQLPMQQQALQGYFEAVVSILDKLFDVSILIRGVSGNFRADRAAAYAEKISGKVLEEFKTLVALKIRWLCRDTPEWLVERLTKVIAMRRQQFYYQRAHREKLSGLQPASQEQAQIRKSDKTEKPTHTIEIEPIKKEALMEKAANAPMARTMRSGTTKKTYETTATDLMPENERVDTSNLPKIAPSEKPAENAFPDPPKEPKDKAFECPQCFHLLPADTRRTVAWTYVTLLLCRLTLPPVHIYFQTFGHILVSPDHAINTTNYSRIGNSGWNTKFNSTILNGGAMLLIVMRHLSEYFRPRMNSATIFTLVTPVFSQSSNYLSYSLEENVPRYFRLRRAPSARPLITISAKSRTSTKLRATNMHISELPRNFKSISDFIFETLRCSHS